MTRYRLNKKGKTRLIVFSTVVLIIVVVIALFGDAMIHRGGDVDPGQTDGVNDDGGQMDVGDGDQQAKSPEEIAQSLASLSDTANATVFYDTPFIPEGGDFNDQLINKVCGVSKDYVPANLQLTKYRATDRAEANQYMIDYAADAMDSMIEGAMNQGYTVLVTTAYRSYGFQSTLYNNYVAKDGQAAADRYSARPGTSEHQSGLAADLTSPSVGYQLTSKLGETPEGQWLREHAHEYGFILRFPQESEDITGYMYEAWHFRYVGVEAATYIYEHDLTLEEYLAEKF